jgi:hypothetical protein
VTSALDGEVPLTRMTRHGSPGPDKFVAVESGERVCGPPALLLPNRLTNSETLSVTMPDVKTLITATVGSASHEISAADASRVRGTFLRGRLAAARITPSVSSRASAMATSRL